MWAEPALGLSQKRTWIMRKELALVLLAESIALTLGLPALAGGEVNPNSGILPPNSNPFGKTYAEWTGAYTTRVDAIPFAENPVWGSGQNVDIGQSGKVITIRAPPPPRNERQ